MDRVGRFLGALPDFMDTISILHNATTAGIVPVVQELMSSERLALSRDQYGATPLHKAVLFYQPKLVKLISEKFPLTTKAKDQEGRTPLHYAAALHDSGIFYRYLLKCGADELIQDKVRIDRPLRLMFALQYGKTAKHYVYAPADMDLNSLVRRCQEMPRKREPTEKKQFVMPAGSPSPLDPPYSHASPPKALTTSNIRNWIRTADLDQLEMVVLEGQVSPCPTVLYYIVVHKENIFLLVGF